jgi:ABC-2 type transport system permease protein
MTRPGTIFWFARHEARLAWRDWLSLMTGGHRRHVAAVTLGFLTFTLFMHGLAYLMLSHGANLTDPTDPHVLLIVTGTLVLTFSLMLSQAIESVTRAFYARGDLELILTSPASTSRLFAVRIAAMVVTTLAMALVLGAPFINMLAWLGGARWLGAYAVAVAMAMDAVAIAVVITIVLFHTIGPRCTRFVAQILAAVVGAAFAIGVQFAAILSYGSIADPRPALFSGLALDRDSAILLPARAVVGEPAALAAMLGVGMAALAVAIHAFAPHFGRQALVAATSQSTHRRSRRQSPFRVSSPAQALRRKEWTLLLRDPWLMSQTLMQLLYLMPAAYLVWRNFYGGTNVTALLVPILIMTAGQLGGGLAWLAVSGEDAPDLIASAPVSRRAVLRAKTEAVLGGVAVVFGPFVIALGIAAPFAALVALAGVVIAAGSATAIQFWFRTQARRSLFRRRQTSSRVATIAEALSSTGWAGTGALAATGTWLAVLPGVVVLAIVAGTWMISPKASSLN